MGMGKGVRSAFVVCVLSLTAQITDRAVDRECAVLPEATPVKLKLLHPLHSKTATEGDPVNFTVAEDVLLNGRPLVKTGAVAIGLVGQAKPARTFGRGGQLSLAMQYVRAGQVRVPLRGTETRAGKGKTGEMVSLAILFGVTGLLKHGSEIEVKEGSLVTAYVDQDTTLPIPAESAQPESEPQN